MRLTLRTLLAYLDDILEPAQTKEIGTKITESGFATSLVSRIREVMRRRRLGAPELDDPKGLDPNTVAEYLDNTLTPDGVADVEKICLESDVHLAEVAACHQVLTLVLGEPVEIVPDSRERMYALTARAAAKPAESEPAQPARTAEAAAPKSDRGSTPVSAAARSKPAATASHPARMKESQVPAYLRPKPIWQRALPFVVGIAALGVFVVLVIRDPAIFGTASRSSKPQVDDGDMVIAQNEPAPPETDVEPADIATGIEPDEDAADQTAPGDTEAQTPDEDFAKTSPDEGRGAGTASPDTAAADGPPAHPDEAATAKPPAAPADQAPDAAVAVPTPPAPGGDAQAASPAEPPLPAAPKILYNSQAGVLLRDNGDLDLLDWRVVPHRAVIHTGERIASVEPFEAQFEIGDDLCRLTLIEATSTRILPPSKDWLLGFDVRQGRLILKSLPGQAAKADAAPPRFALKVDEDLWRIQPLTPDTVCGIQVRRLPPDQFELLPEPRPYMVVLFITGGTLLLDDMKGHEGQVGAGNFVVLTPATDDPAEGLPAPTIEVLRSPPDWMSDESRRLQPAALRTAKLFEQEFQLEQPLKNYIPNLVISPNPKPSALAVKVLAITENAPLMIDALSQKGQHEESRLAAIDGLRAWLTLSPDNGKKLPELLRKSFHEEDAKIAAELLWGFDEQDAENLAIANRLVDLMDHDNVAIRELAFHNVVRLTDRRYEYRANLPPPQRSLAVTRWRRYVERENGLLRK